MSKKTKNESKILFSLLGVVFFMLVITSLTHYNENNIYKAQEVANMTVFESLNQRASSSITEKVSDYTIKHCSNINHSDGEILKVCLADFKGGTTGFYDSSKELLVISSFNNSLLVHEIFHASSLHYINKGMTDMSGHVAQETMAYNAEFLYDQIIAFKGDIISMETSKRLAEYYKIKK